MHFDFRCIYYFIGTFYNKFKFNKTKATIFYCETNLKEMKEKYSNLRRSFQVSDLFYIPENDRRLHFLVFFLVSNRTF